MKHVELLVRLCKQAGAPSEASTDRDGAFSHHAETHAAGLGIAAGFAAVAFSEMSLFSIVYGGAVHGRISWDGKKRRRIIKDVRQEPHYALGGIVLGALVGIGARIAAGVPLLPFGV